MPVSGTVTLSVKDKIRVQVNVINVSAGGLCISAPTHVLDQDEYQIQIITPANGTINFSGLPVYQNEDSIGIKITSIDKDQLKIIYQIIGNFQLTDEFIKHVDERDIIHDWLVDESGKDIAITFDSEPKTDN